MKLVATATDILKQLTDNKDNDSKITKGNQTKSLLLPTEESLITLQYLLTMEVL